MKTHSLTILHYGADYLSYALRSVYHNVDQCHIFFTPTPSHGHQTTAPPIETKEELQAAAYAYDPENKIKWYDLIGVAQEGPQRDIALKTVQAAGADLVVVVDYDEIWGYQVLGSLIYRIWDSGKARNNLVNMTHLWRSFNWACNDQGWPVRIIDLRHSDGEFYIPQEFDVYHFGYAITDRVMTYKWQIHGHKNEMRPGWLENIWPHWPPVYPDADGKIQYPGDTSFCCHPTNDKNFWEPEPFDKAKLPLFMTEHPFWGLDKIE